MQPPATRAARILAHLKSKRIAAALDVWLGTPKNQRPDVQSLLDPMAVQHLELADRRLRKRKEEKREEERKLQLKRDAAKQQADEAERQAAESFKQAIAKARVSGGDPARMAAVSSWPVAKLDPLLEKDERERCREMRRSAMWAAKVREALGCTPTELDRWDADGRLGHAFTKTTSPGGKAVQGRKWLAADVEAALPYLTEWRDVDRHRKRARRTKLRLVKA